MTSIHDQYLEKAKELNCSAEKYTQLEEVMTVAKKAQLPFSNISEITSTFEFSLSLAGAVALHESYKVNGNDGRIVYLNSENQLVNHYVDGRIEIIEKRT